MSPQVQLQPQRQATVTRQPEPSYSQSTHDSYRYEQNRREEAARLAADRQKQEERERQEAAGREAIRLAAETERQAREYALLVEAHHSYLKEQWLAFQNAHCDAPPTLLPLEAKAELKRFAYLITKQSQRVIEQPEWEKFNQEVEASAKEAEALVQEIEQKLNSTSLLTSLRKLFGAGKLIELLRKCVVSFSVPDLGSPAREAIAAARRFLR